MIKHFLKKALLLQFFLLLSCILFAQQKTVTGKVLDADNKPIQGVTVGVKGTTTNVATDANGAFSIVVPSSQSVLKFTSAGYIADEQTVGTKSIIVQILQKNNKQMDEVVVVGYGTKKRVNVQGAVSTVKAAEIEDLPVANLGSALVNRVPGVSVNFASGKPGSTTDINIRNSITFPGTTQGVTTQPLYVIDGIIVNPTVWAQSGNPDFFENLDASQIEDITFLKDASAAIYGAAGAKGVILITTKKGKAGKPKLSYSGYLGRTDAAVQTKSLSAYEHAKMLNDGFELNNTALTSRFSQADLDRLALMPNRAWYDDIWKPGQVIRHTISASGGSDRVTFFAGGSYYNEKGNYGDVNVDKYSIRTGMDAKIIDGLTTNISFSSDFNHETRNTLKGANPETDDLSIRALYLTPKWVPLMIKGVPAAWSGPNPPGNWSWYGLANSGNYTQTKSQGLSVNASLEYKPNFLKGFTARVQYGRLNRNNADKQYYPPYKVANFVRNGNNGLLYSDSINASTPSFTLNNNQMSEGSTISSSYQLITTLSYAKKFRDHDFDIMIGNDQSEAESRNIFLTKFQQLISGVDEFWAFSNDLTTAATITDLIRNPQADQFAKRSYLGRMNYSFKSKYFLEVIARYDASSNFNPDHRWGLFPTVGLGWKISDEKFFRDITFINSLKLRANLGVVGEDRVSNKTYVNRFTQTTGYLFGNVNTNGLDPNLYPNPDATWEKSRTFNVGFDATVYRGKINVSGDVYQRYTYDGFNALDASLLPLTAGLPSAVVNYGRQLSWGTEFNVGYSTRFGKDWGFNTSINFGWSNSQLLQSYYNPSSLGLYGSTAVSSYLIGKDPRTFNGNNYGYIATGILRTQEEVDAILAKNPNYTISGVKPQVGFLNYKDVNGDGKIDDNDITLMFDKTTAVVGFGITIGVTYKSFRLSTNLNLTVGGKRFYDSEARKVPTTTQNAPDFWKDYWTPANPNAKYPRADAPLAKELSTFWAVNGTQSRINNMVLSYSIPKALSTRLKIPDFRVLVTGTNLWSLINPLKYKDPYTSNYASYPTLRTLSVGLNVSL